MNRRHTSLSLLTLLSLTLPSTALGVVRLRTQDLTPKPPAIPAPAAPALPTTIGPGEPAPGATPSSLDDLDDIVTHKVRLGNEQFVIQTQGRSVRSVKINNKDAAPSRVRVDGDSLRVLDESGLTRTSIQLTAPGASLSGAGAVTSGSGAFLSTSPSRSAFAQRNRTTAPPAAGTPAAEAPDLAQLAGRAVMVGLQMMPIDPALSGHLGLAPNTAIMVAGVVPGLPADLAGLKPFDVITRIDTRAAQDVNTLRSVLLERNAAPGDTLKMRIISAGQTKDVELTLAPLQLDRLAGNNWNTVPEEAQRAEGQQLDANLSGALQRAQNAGVASARAEGTRNPLAIGAIPLLATTPAEPAAGSPFGISPGPSRQIMILRDAESNATAPSAELEARLLRIESALDEILRRLPAVVATSPSSFGKASTPPGPATPSTRPAAGSPTPAGRP